MKEPGASRVQAARDAPGQAAVIAELRGKERSLYLPGKRGARGAERRFRLLARDGVLPDAAVNEPCDLRVAASPPSFAEGMPTEPSDGVNTGGDRPAVFVEPLQAALSLRL